jgi:regulator of replication initiation timing
MSKVFERHPLSALWPDQTAEEWAETERTVAAHGVLKAILIFEGKVLDGWHRYKAADNAGQDFPTEEFTGTYEEAKERLRVEHLARRSLTPSQRSLAIAEMTDWAPPHRQKGDALAPFTTVQEQAELAQVSERTMQRARTVLRNAIPRVKDAVRGGDLNVDTAAKIAQLPKREQAAALAKPAQVKPPKNERPKWRAPEGMPKPEVGASKEAYEELLERNRFLAEENDLLNDRIAVLASGGVATDEERAALDETLKELRTQVRALEAEAAGLKATRNVTQAENNELKAEVRKLRNQLTRYRDDDKKAA